MARPPGRRRLSPGGRRQARISLAFVVFVCALCCVAIAVSQARLKPSSLPYGGGEIDDDGDELADLDAVFGVGGTPASSRSSSSSKARPAPRRRNPSRSGSGAPGSAKRSAVPPRKQKRVEAWAQAVADLLESDSGVDADVCARLDAAAASDPDAAAPAIQQCVRAKLAGTRRWDGEGLGPQGAVIATSACASLGIAPTPAIRSVITRELRFVLDRTTLALARDSFYAARAKAEAVQRAAKARAAALADPLRGIRKRALRS